jgi:hypothetical protein
MNDEIATYKSELHYVVPHLYPGGNSAKCSDCRYFFEDLKNKKYSPYSFWGECHSNAHQTERGYTHKKNGWDKTLSNGGCKWWFPIEKQEGENETFIN